jgi:hypothetical protein
MVMSDFEILRRIADGAPKMALRVFIAGLKKVYNIAKVSGHRDYNKAKACPCFDAKNEYEDE